MEGSSCSAEALVSALVDPEFLSVAQPGAIKRVATTKAAGKKVFTKIKSELFQVIEKENVHRGLYFLIRSNQLISIYLCWLERCLYTHA